MSRLQVLLVLAMLVLAFSIVACDALSGAPPTFIKNVVMARAVQGANIDPVGVSDTFAPDAPEFHAVVTLQNAPKDTAIKAVWTAVDVGTAAAPNTKINEAEVKADGSRNLDFKLGLVAQKWNAGLYQVELYVNDKLDRTLSFVVAGTAQQAGLQAAGTCPPATTQPHKDTGTIAQVIMTAKVDGNNEATDRTGEFLPNDVVYAVVAIKDTPPNTKFKVVFYAVDADGSKICNVTLRVGEPEQVGDGTRNLAFSAKPSEPWKLGKYRVDVYVNNTLDHTTNYVVVTQRQVH
jgi:hypothetical protein